MNGALPTFLPFAEVGCPTPLLSTDGQPVWPVSTQVERERLAAIAEACGVALVPVTARMRRSLPQRDDAEVVVAFGAGLSDEARLFAHLTGRDARAVDDVRSLSCTPRVAVVLCLFADLTFELIEAIHALGQQHATVVGIVVARDERAMRVEVLVRSAAGVFGLAKPDRATIAAAPSLPVRAFERSRCVIFGADAEPAELRRHLGEAHGVFALVSHSDGVDAQLGKGVVLCPRHAWSDFEQDDDSPSCVRTGHCIRLRKPAHEAVLDPRTIAPREIRARIALLATCFGTLAADALVAPRWSLLVALLDNPSIGAVIATWEVVNAHVDDLEAIVPALAMGATVSASVQAFREAQKLNGDRVRFIVFGDPRSHLVETGAATSLPPPKRRVAVRPRRTDRYAWLLTLAGVDPSGTGGGAPVEPAELLERIASRGTIPSADWGARAGDFENTYATIRCFGCGLPARRYEGDVGGWSRVIDCCPRCGIVRDAEPGAVGGGAGIFVEADEVVITLPRGHDTRHARLTLETARREIVVLPAAEQERVTRAVREAGRCVIAVFSLKGDQLLVLRRPVALGMSQPTRRYEWSGGAS